MTMSIDLRYPIQRVDKIKTSFTEGKDCVAIVRAESGGWWLAVDTHNRFFVADADVCPGGVHDRRDTVAPEPSAEDKLPDGVKRAGNAWECTRCGRFFTKLHAWKVHNGSTHAGER